MDINNLISIIKKKITKDIICESLKIEDKSFLHKNHTGNDNTKFHIKLLIQSQQLKEMGRVESNKKIYKILNDEISTSIHSLQILIH
tara:strand:+ start:150 stop:410 length:261 start_codon:yes stop_codon:yes gene_type:complete